MTIQQIKQRYGIIGNSREINTAVEIAMQVAPTDVTVLVYGENGTGKDVFSQIIHAFSKRKHKSLIAINTGAIPEGTIDSELFGHEKGSFTSAYDARKGYFEEVDGGTIFLDEIGEMPLATQARLLRLLETGDYLRVGSSKPQRADVRVIAATNRNLVEMIRNGRFREDLFFRLNTVTIHVPPLRERGDDIELLFNYFALEFGEKYQRDAIMLDEEAVPLLYKYRWPGNIRELRNLVEKLTVLVKGEWVSPTVLQKNLLIQETYLPSVITRVNGTDFEPNPEGLRGKDQEVLLKLIDEVAELKRMVAYLGLKDQQRESGQGGYGRSAESSYGSTTLDADSYEPEIYHSGQPIRRSPTPLLEESLNLEKKERELIIKALTKHNNNRKKAAVELGISERTLYRKINNYDIEL